MLDSLYSGISGLDSFQKTLNTEANNISNVNTIAYKSDVVSFADLMYQDGYGKGTSIVTVNKDFAQGDFKLTGNAYDMAIDGRGFFTVHDNKNDETYFTRAGNFGMNIDGYLQTQSGEQVMGVSIDPIEKGVNVVATNADVTQFGNEYTNFLATQSVTSTTILQSINAKATNYNETAKATGEEYIGAGYKTASAQIRDVEALATAYRSQLSSYGLDPSEGISKTDPVGGVAATSQTSSVTFPASSVVNYGDEVSIYIDSKKYVEFFDTDEATTLKKLSDKISNLDGLTASVDTTIGAFTITSLIPGKTIPITGAGLLTSGTVTQPNITTTDAIKGSGLAAVTAMRDALKTAVEFAGAEFLELTNNVDLQDQTDLKLGSLQLKLDEKNISSSAYGDFSVDDGALYMTQGDNRFLVGKVVTSIFADKKGLDPQGNNLFKKSDESGDPIYTPGVNKVKNEIIELSNADFSKGLVNMMTFQRSFEASSKTINTSDEILKTTLQLKK